MLIIDNVLRGENCGEEIMLGGNRKIFGYETDPYRRRKEVKKKQTTAET